MIYFVSRHNGAKEWAEKQGMKIDEIQAHIDANFVEKLHDGDLVVGNVPMQFVADICAKGARYIHLTVNVPAEWRGRDLSCADMEALNPLLEEYQVTRKDFQP